LRESLYVPSLPPPPLLLLPLLLLLLWSQF
jgi:hypothetical protein